MERSTTRNCRSIDAVAPQTVSPISSKKNTGRDFPSCHCQISSLKMSGLRSSANGTSMISSTSMGLASRAGTVSSIPTNGVTRELLPTVTKLSRVPTNLGSSGLSPIYSWASRIAVAHRSWSSGSWLPPGKLTSWVWCFIIADLLVKITCSSSWAEQYIGMSTAERLCSFVLSVRVRELYPEIALSKASRVKAVRSFPSQGAGAPGCQDSGRGIFWDPPLPISTKSVYFSSMSCSRSSGKPPVLRLLITLPGGVSPRSHSIHWSRSFWGLGFGFLSMCREGTHIFYICGVSGTLMIF